MSKGFRMTLLFLSVIGLVLFHYIIKENCADKFWIGSIPCEERFLCKMKVIKSLEQVEQEMKAQNIYSISGPRAITQCVPVYTF